MRVSALSTIILALVILVGCSESPLEDPLLAEGPVEFETLAQEGDFESLAEGYWGNHDFDERTTIVLRNQENFSAFWQAYFGSDALDAKPSVDFSEEMVVALILGAQPTTGYAIEAQSVVHISNRLEIEAEETRPGENCGTGQAITHPYHIIAVPATDAAVEAIDDVRVLDCD